MFDRKRFSCGLAHQASPDILEKYQPALITQPIRALDELYDQDNRQLNHLKEMIKAKKDFTLPQHKILSNQKPKRKNNLINSNDSKINKFQTQRTSVDMQNKVKLPPPLKNSSNGNSAVNLTFR